MGLSVEDAMEQYDSWDSFLMHHSGWFVEDGELGDWGALPASDEDEAEAADHREHVEMAEAGRVNPEGLDGAAAFHTTDEEDGPFYPDEFIAFDED